MDWTSIYQSRVTTAAEAVRCIQSNQRIFLTGNVSVPQKCLAALVDYAPNLENVEICQALTIGPADYVKPEMEGHLRVNTLFISHNVRKAVQEGRADFTPVLLSEFPLLFKHGVLPLDAAIIHVSPPDEHGFCSLGVEVGLTKSPAESAKIIIAEVNQQMPRTLGDSFIHVSRLSHIVPVNYPIPEMAMSEEGNLDVVEKIAGFVAELIPDGATMQLGIGAIPDAVLKFLHSKKDLGVHSELFSDGVIELVNPEQNYVLINCEQRLNIPAGTEIVSQGADGSKTKLKVTPERKGNYITADITEGTPQLRDLVLYKVKPGDVPAPAPVTVSASGAVVPLTPVMQADVIPPLDAPFQPIAPLKSPPAPTQPPASVPTEEPVPDLSKLPPVIR